MSKLASIALIIALVLISPLSVNAAGSAGGSGNHLGTSVGKVGKDSGRHENARANAPQMKAPSVEQKNHVWRFYDAPPTPLSKQEWDNNYNFLGPSHNGMERHFVWK